MAGCFLGLAGDGREGLLVRIDNTPGTTGIGVVV